MDARRFGKSGWSVSPIGFGAWAIGGAWGAAVPERDAEAALETALDAGVTFLDTADVYGDGRSEQLIGRVLARRGHPADVTVATKAGRRLNPHTTEGYTKANLGAFLDRSRQNLGRDTIDLLQLHCPPTEAYYTPAVFDALEDFVAEGRIKAYGVSVEKVEEGLKAVEYPNLTSVQIIYNMLRQRPGDLFLDRARAKDVAVIARVPLASGLLTGKMSAATSFAPDDHRQFNRQGEAFDVGETFAGLPFEVGLQAVAELQAGLDTDAPLAQKALRWIVQDSRVTTTIPGAKTPDQARSNVAAGRLPPLSGAELGHVRQVYTNLAAPYVHQRW